MKVNCIYYNPDPHIFLNFIANAAVFKEICVEHLLLNNPENYRNLKKGYLSTREIVKDISDEKQQIT